MKKLIFLLFNVMFSIVALAQNYTEPKDTVIIRYSNDSTQGKSQPYIKRCPEYLDEYIIDKIIDSLRLHKVSNFIIYQTNVDSKIVIDTSLIKNDTIMVSYLLSQENGRIKSFIITDSFVYESISDIEDNAKIFSYPHSSQLWTRADEDGVIGDKLIAIIPEPIVAYPYGKEIVVFITPTYKRFFEFGENVHYQLKPSRSKYRKEYVSLLNSVVLQLNNTWMKIFKNEKRWGRWEL